MATKKALKKQFDNCNIGCEISRPLFTKYFDEELTFLKDLLYNSVKIENLDFYNEHFVKHELFERGFVGYSETVDKFYRTLPAETKQQDGRFWKNGQFFDEDNKNIGAHKYNFGVGFGDVWRILISTPNKTQLFRTLENYASLLAECRIGIRQNISAIKTPSFWVTDNEDLALSIRHVIAQTQDGEPAIVVKQALSDNLTTLKNETPFVADKIHQEYRELLNEVLSRVGILTANTSKRERVQSAEVNAGIGQTIDSIYTIIDCWNKQIDSYSLPYKMSLNAVVEELYEDNETTEITSNESVVRGENND